MRKILVVDDHPVLAEFMELFLFTNGFDVEIASSRAGMLSLLEFFKPDLIILDVMLGPENGREICKETKSGPQKHIPVILYSADPDMLTNYQECGANDAVEKPFELTYLLKKIDIALGGTNMEFGSA